MSAIEVVVVTVEEKADAWRIIDALVPRLDEVRPIFSEGAKEKIRRIHRTFKTASWPDIQLIVSAAKQRGVK